MELNNTNWIFVFLLVFTYCTDNKSYDHDNNTFVESFNEPEVQLPINGDIQYYSTKSLSEATLTIKVPSGDRSTYVKLKDAIYKTDVLSVFIRAGKTVTIKMPLGSYKLNYANGKKWYGTEFLFGPNTSYNATDDVFKFERTTDQNYEYFSQWTVELIMQQQGNLQTRKINPRDF